MKKVARRTLKAKVIFNAKAGPGPSSTELLEQLIEEMGRQNIEADTFMVYPECKLDAEVRSAIRRGFQLIVAVGGDGTINSTASAMVGSRATLGIVAAGTNNNVALSLGIPTEMPEAVRLLREGRRLKVDIGQIQAGRKRRVFVEAAYVGLLSDLYPVAENIEHGELGQIGELLSMFASATPSNVRLTLDGRKQVDATAHVVLIDNMTYLGTNIQMAKQVSCTDGRLDVFVFSDLGKLDLAAYTLQLVGGGAEHERIQHYRVRQLTIDSKPKMAVSADGAPMGNGRVTASVLPRALSAMTGLPAQPARSR